MDAFGAFRCVCMGLDTFGRVWTGFGQVWIGFGRVWKGFEAVWRSLEEFDQVLN